MCTISHLFPTRQSLFYFPNAILVIFEGNKNEFYPQGKYSFKTRKCRFESYNAPSRDKTVTNDITLHDKLRYFQTSEKPNGANLITVIYKLMYFSLKYGKFFPGGLQFI